MEPLPVNIDCRGRGAVVNSWMGSALINFFSSEAKAIIGGGLYIAETGRRAILTRADGGG
ncbi:MAG: hypothetical protein CDV28_11710 [Candidatus Electronema aureum]|uniref:Uncharacterized protein n=1 Tax=Candidatus Electronema aureum TaxID=2005002 RepID=A0A521G197_9BACT|nr:MAG: hypothetical protein CDV28_11710 [Candidatus Electronema aureum]